MTQPLRLAGRTAVVTGTSSGLGAAIAAALAAEGAAVVGFARRHAATGALAAAPAAGRVTELCVDVVDEAAVRARFAELAAHGAGVDILVNNAGGMPTAPVIDQDIAVLRHVLDVQVVAAFVCAQEALRQMARHRRGGHIINVSSIAAFKTFPGAAAYTAAKEALRGFTRVLVEEARAHDVRVTGLYPGATDTPLWDGAPFERARMMQPASLAQLVCDLIARPDMNVEELVVMPPGGAL
jgi:NAD(P)-dependent dehydrogenase (short-subunit alcohol dehydrogenase family)